MTRSAPPSPGRRTTRARQRLDITLVLAVLLPLLGAGALALVQQDEPSRRIEAPTTVPLTQATLACPSAQGDDRVWLTSATDGVEGTALVGLDETQVDADVASGDVTVVGDQPDPLAVVAEDEVAPGLAAARFGRGAPAAATCPAPEPAAWFTGVGAGAAHSSVLELVNPDSGTAVVDVTVFGRTGAVDADQLAGIAVPGRSSVQLDLAALIPRRDELSLQVVTARGRVGALLLDRYDPVGSADLTQDWLPAQPAPSTSNLLMGLVTGSGRRTLVVTNTTGDEVRADLRVVTKRSTYAPEGMPEIRIAPYGVQRVSIAKVLGPAIKDGAIGLLLDSTGEVTASVRTYADGDLSHAVPNPVVDSASTVLLPEGGKNVKKVLQLSGATQQGAVTVTARSASGEELREIRAEISPELGVAVKLPKAAVAVTVVPERTPVSGAVLVSDPKGAAVVPLTVAATSGLVPAVRPGVP